MFVKNRQNLIFGIMILLLKFAIANTKDWELYNGHEYHFAMENEDSFATWHSGRAFCMGDGGDLASILDQAELDFVLNKTKNNKVWIGLNSLADRETWTWSDGENVEYEDWKEDFPTNPVETNNFHLCVEIEVNEKTGSWRNVHCDNPRGFVCKRKEGFTEPVTDRPTPSVGGYCPTGYFNFDINDNKCYRMHMVGSEPEGITFEQARDECRMGPGHSPDLVSIHSDYENAILLSQIQKAYRNIYIGLQRTNSQWRWTDNTDFNYYNWDDGEPGAGVDCAELRTLPLPGVWHTVTCQAKLGYICQTFKSDLISAPPNTTPHPCPPGYKPYWYACYNITDETYNWPDARGHCQNSYNGAELASIHSFTENAALFAELHLQGGEAWIGLNDILHTGGYNWTDGWSVLHTEWGENEPSENDGCVSMHQDGKWYDDICADRKKAICKYTDEKPVLPPAPPEGVCPGEMEGIKTDWIKFNNYCYHFEQSESIQWSAARVRCMDIGGPTSQLASIHDIQENRFIEEQIKGSSNVWTGMFQQKSDGAYAWVDNTPVEYTRWSPGEPSSDDEQCVEMHANSGVAGYWNDKMCDRDNGFVCKSEQIEPPESVDPDSCPEHWFSHGDFCFYFEPNVFTNWDTAQMHCEDFSDGKAKLVSIDDFYMNTWIKNQYEMQTNMPEPHNYWIGLFKKGPLDSGYQFQWVDGSAPMFHYWDQEEPSDNYGTENCAEANPISGFWMSAMCSKYRGYICKMSKESEKTGGMTGGQIAGIVIGVLLGLAVIVAILFFLGNRLGYVKKPKSIETKFQEFADTESATQTPQASRREEN